VDDEAKIGFVKTHSQSRRRYQSLDAIVQQAFLKKFTISIRVIAELGIKTRNSALCLYAAIVGIDLLEFRVLYQPRRQLHIIQYTYILHRTVDINLIPTDLNVGSTFRIVSH